MEQSLGHITNLDQHWDDMQCKAQKTMKGKGKVIKKSQGKTEKQYNKRKKWGKTMNDYKGEEVQCGLERQ